MDLASGVSPVKLLYSRRVRMNLPAVTDSIRLLTNQNESAVGFDRDPKTAHFQTYSRN
jgi:hypothetical protein